MAHRRARFETTQWSLVLAAGAETSPDTRTALATLCEHYWLPLYSYVRRRGYSSENAQDLTQAFLTRFLDKRDVRDARRERGRFRSFLLASLKHFLLNDAQHHRAQKRGGGTIPLPLEFETAERRYLLEPVDTRTPEKIFDRRWALTVIDRALQRLRHEASEAGKSEQFHKLRVCLTGDSPSGGYRALAVELGLTEDAARVAVHRLRRRFQRIVRDEIAETVSSGAEAEEELRYLMKSLL